MPGIDPNMPNSKGKTIKDYLPAAMAKLMGGQMQGMQPPQESATAAADQPIGKKQIDEAIGTLQEYKRGKAAFESRLLEEEIVKTLAESSILQNFIPIA